MKFLCKLFGCEPKTIIKEVVKEVPVEVVKEVPVSVQQSYPKKPEPPVLSGSPQEQLIQIYDHYGFTRPAQAYFDHIGDTLTPEYIERVLELIDVINDKTIEYMNRPACDEEVRPALATPSIDMLRRKVKGRKDRSRLDYVVDAVRNDLPICGCKAAQQ